MLRERRRCRDLRQLLRQQKVPRVAVRDGLYFILLADAADVVLKDNLHFISPSTVSMALSSCGSAVLVEFSSGALTSMSGFSPPFSSTCPPGSTQCAMVSLSVEPSLRSKTSCTVPLPKLCSP